LLENAQVSQAYIEVSREYSAFASFFEGYGFFTIGRIVRGGEPMMGSAVLPSFILATLSNLEPQLTQILSLLSAMILTDCGSLGS